MSELDNGPLPISSGDKLLMLLDQGGQEAAVGALETITSELTELNQGIVDYPRRNKYEVHPERDIRPETVIDFKLDYKMFVQLTRESNFELLSPADSMAVGVQMLEFIKKIDPYLPPHLVFLDRSARPASWMLTDLWKRLYKHCFNAPQIDYINIGTEKFGEDMERLYFESKSEFESNIAQRDDIAEIILTNLLSPKKNDALRFEEMEQYEIDDGIREDQDDESAKAGVSSSSETIRDYTSTLWIVDDVRNTGISLEMAVLLYRSALNRGNLITNVYPVYLFAEQEFAVWWKQDSWKGIGESHPGDIMSSPLLDISNSKKLRGDLEKTTANIISCIKNVDNVLSELMSE